MGSRDGKREHERQSGSNKTGVKAVEKRHGGGAHNWGNVKDDLKDFDDASGRPAGSALVSEKTISIVKQKSIENRLGKSSPTKKIPPSTETQSGLNITKKGSEELRRSSRKKSKEDPPN